MMDSAADAQLEEDSTQQGNTENVLTLDDLQCAELKFKTSQVLLTVSTSAIGQALSALQKCQRNVELACWKILEEQAQQRKEGLLPNLELNEYIDIDTRLRVYRLRDMHTNATLQECYIAIRIAKGDMDDAVKHLEYLQVQQRDNQENGSVGFLVDTNYTEDPKW